MAVAARARARWCVGVCVCVTCVCDVCACVCNAILFYYQHFFLGLCLLLLPTSHGSCIDIDGPDDWL